MFVGITTKNNNNNSIKFLGIIVLSILVSKCLCNTENSTILTLTK